MYHSIGATEMAKRDQIAAEVQELNNKLKEAAAEAEYINAQEKMFGWAATKYNVIAKVMGCFKSNAVPKLNREHNAFLDDVYVMMGQILTLLTRMFYIGQ